MGSMNTVEKEFFRCSDLGSERWWQQVQELGTPVVTVAGEGMLGLTFVWREPQGVRVAPDYVYIDVYSHTPHPVQRQTSLSRVADTDVWLWHTELPEDWLGSYFLLPVTAAQAPPETRDAVLMRRWWTQLLDTAAIADPLNLLPGHCNGWGGRLSRIQLDKAIIDPVWRTQDRIDTAGLVAIASPIVHSLCWNSLVLANSRQVWIYVSQSETVTVAESQLPLVILLDGHYWAKHQPVFSALDELTKKHELPPAVYVLIDGINPRHRALEMTCNPEFWHAVEAELLPQVAEFQRFSDDAEQRVLVGQSFGGLAASYAALHWPHKYGAVLSQSASFWWPDAQGGAQSAWLIRQLEDGQLKKSTLKFYLEVGCYEDDMRAINQSMCLALRAQGHHVIYHEFRGGHDWICWRNGLLRGLRSLLGSTCAPMSNHVYSLPIL
jgi:enterochelin esterase family protein